MSREKSEKISYQESRSSLLDFFPSSLLRFGSFGFSLESGPTASWALFDTSNSKAYFSSLPPPIVKRESARLCSCFPFKSEGCFVSPPPPPNGRFTNLW